MKKYILFFLGHKKPFKYIIANILRFTGLCNFFTIHRENYKLKFFPTNLSTATRTDPTYRIEDLKVLRKILHKGDVFVDIGANIGTISLEASYIVGKEGKVFSFEPTSHIYHYFIKNITLNNKTNIVPYNIALGNDKKEISLSASHADTMNKIGLQGGLSVLMNTLDNVLTHVHDINLMKVDVEGYEKFVFLGAKHVLQYTQAVYFEAIEEMYNYYNYSTKDILQLLEKEGFRIYGSYDDMLYPIPTHFISKGANLFAIKNIDTFIDKTSYRLY